MWGKEGCEGGGAPTALKERVSPFQISAAFSPPPAATTREREFREPERRNVFLVTGGGGWRLCRGRGEWRRPQQHRVLRWSLFQVKLKERASSGIGSSSRSSILLFIPMSQNHKIFMVPFEFKQCYFFQFLIKKSRPLLAGNILPQLKFFDEKCTVNFISWL